MSVYANLFICFIIFCFSTCVNLYSDVLLILEYRVTLLVLLFELVSCNNNCTGNDFGLSVRVKISTHYCKLVGLLPSMYVYMYMGLSLLYVIGE